MLSRDSLEPARWRRADGAAVEWRISPGLTPYAEAVAFMEARAEAIAAGAAREQVWLLEHPPIYTAGTSAKDGDLIDRALSVCTGLAAAANSPITGRASESPM